MRRLTLLTAVGLLALAALSGCSNNPTSNSFGTVNLQMTDAPGDFQAVNLVVNEVAVQHGGGNGGWEVLTSQPRTFDLLQLRNGVFATLGVSSIPAGKYTQLRLKLGSGSTVVVNGASHPLVVSSNDQLGLKLVGAFEVPKRGRVDLALDFDVARSLRANDDGSYRLDPVIRVVATSIPEQRPGAIHGQALPSEAAASVFVLSNADTVASSLADESGNFTVGLLPAGTYSVTFHSVNGFRDASVSGVVVNWNATTEMGAIQLQSAPPPPPPPPPTKGTISGLVMPLGVQASVQAMQGDVVVAEVPLDMEGRFLLLGLPAGSYDVWVHAGTDFEVASRMGVSVVAGMNSDLGLIELSPAGPPPPPPPPQPGAITGQIVPAGIPTTVSAMQGNTVVGQADADGNGNFTIGQLPPGTYTLFIVPLFDFSNSSVPNVEVNSGSTTNVGQIQLSF